MDVPGKVSVIMPAYNCARYVSEAIDSVLKQTYTDLELLVIDDSSDDDTFAVVEMYEARDVRVRGIKNPKNIGVAATRNRGIEIATGEYIAFLDADDVWIENKIEKQLQILLEKDADIVYSSYCFINEKSQKIKRPYFVPAETNYQKMLVENVIGLSTVLIKTKLMKKHCFKDSVQHEDYVLWLEFLQDLINAVGCKEVLMCYRQDRDSRNNNKLRAAKERWKIYRQTLGMSFIQSAVVFVRYVFWGVLKYYL